MNYNNLTSQKLNENCKSSLHLFIIRVKSSKRNLIQSELKKNYINTNLHYIPIYAQPYYNAMGFSENDFPEAKAYYSEAISLPMYPGLSFSQQDKVIEELSFALRTG